MDIDQGEALVAVETINEELNETYSEFEIENKPIVTITLADYFFAINISIPDDYTPFEIQLCNSENNDRCYDEDNDQYQPWYDYIKGRFFEVKEKLTNINL